MKLGTAALASASLLCFATPVFAQAGNGWYFGLGGGWSQLQDVDFGATARNAFRGDVTGGFKTPDGFRVEFEGAWTHDPIDHCCGSVPEGTGGWVNLGTIMVNGAYDFPVAPGVALTLGGGIGAGFVTAHDFPFEIDTGETTEFAYQLIAGLVWSINPVLDLQLDYRWVSIPETEHDFLITRNGVNSNNIMLSFRWYLEPPARTIYRAVPFGYYAPPPPPPPPPPPQ